ncbi:MAG: alanine racemase [Acidobacteria bacterium]|uniref:Alanine racemase n=1 Tax=Candidatus Polarisedimenticola svalbardensis TaxID=2886004 RepID=A0A8J6YA74_9BACT|nr:alanine racemase [Candidatus Polarisedimenticola svalbardensis]
MLNWVEIDATALRNNLKLFREKIGGKVELAPVVKSNAYGHGMLTVTGLCQDLADRLCVNSLGEAAALRRAGVELPIVVMGYVEQDDLAELVEMDLQPVVSNLPTLDRLAAEAGRQSRTVKVHLKAETGTHRQGAARRDLQPFVERIAASPGLALEGLSTHYANIEDTTDHSFATAQIATFGAARKAVEGWHGKPVPVCHTACSAATLLLQETHMDLVRIGIALYGLWPSRETLVSCRDEGGELPDLRPVMTWKSRIAQIGTVEEGSYIGYGCTYRTTRESKIAVLPCGYNEGYDRRLSGVGHVLIRGRRAPVRGRVCMNMTMVDVTDIPDAGLEDEAVLLGAQDDERISAEQLSGWCGTIPYEVVTRVNPALPRIVVRPEN